MAVIAEYVVQLHDDGTITQCGLINYAVPEAPKAVEQDTPVMVPSSVAEAIANLEGAGLQPEILDSQDSSAGPSSNDQAWANHSELAFKVANASTTAELGQLWKANKADWTDEINNIAKQRKKEIK